MDTPTTHKRRLRRGLVAIALLITPVTLDTLTSSPVTAEAPVAAAPFDYSMPARYVDGPDADHDLDGFFPGFHCNDDDVCSEIPQVNPNPIDPASWHVDLTACDNGEAVHFAWSVVGFPDITSNGPECEQSIDVPAEGTYRVTLDATLADGEVRSITSDVIVQDFLIVSLGDSYGSGEGVPNEVNHIGVEARWGDRRCHRSQFAGSSVAASIIEQADPHTSVTFIHLACSGAEAITGLLEPYDGLAGTPEQENMEPIRPQIEIAEELIGDRELDAMYISVGGNDANFSKVVTACIAYDPCIGSAVPSASTALTICLPFVPVPLVYAACVLGIGIFLYDFAGGYSASHYFQEGLIGDGTDGDIDSYRLSKIYARLDEALFDDGAGFSDLDMMLPDRYRERISLSEYVDATGNDDATYCTLDSALPGVDEDEYKWLDPQVEQRLNAVVTHNAERFGYSMINGIHSGFRTHGMCADDTWMTSLPDSIWDQFDSNGTAHPNKAGHRYYASRILSTWLPQLYPGGVSTVTLGSDLSASVEAWTSTHAPRAPEQAPVVIPGGPYEVDEGSFVSTANQTYDDLGGFDSLWETSDPTVAQLISPDTYDATIKGIDDGTADITLTATDVIGLSASATTTVTVHNVAPSITSLDASTEPTRVDNPVTASVAFDDPGALDTHTVQWNWGDGTVSTTPVTAGHSQSAEHVYAGAGMYTITAKVADDDGGVSVEQAIDGYVVVYDPDAGFVTGAAKLAESSNELFHFEERYLQDDIVPTGNTALAVKSTGLDFRSESFDWLVVSGQKATWKGTGTLNGVTGHTFLASAIDGSVEGASTADRFRIQISDPTGVVVFDNGAGPDTADPVATIKGQIQING